MLRPHAVKPTPLARTATARRARHRRHVAPKATSAFGVKVLEGPDDDPSVDASEFAGIEIVRPDAQGNVPEDDVGFAGIEIMREESPSEPQLDVAFAGIEICAPLQTPPSWSSQTARSSGWRSCATRCCLPAQSLRAWRLCGKTAHRYVEWRRISLCHMKHLHHSCPWRTA